MPLEQLHFKTCSFLHIACWHTITICSWVGSFNVLAKLDFCSFVCDSSRLALWMSEPWNAVSTFLWANDRKFELRPQIWVVWSVSLLSISPGCSCGRSTHVKYDYQWQRHTNLVGLFPALWTGLYHWSFWKHMGILGWGHAYYFSVEHGSLECELWSLTVQII